MAYVVCISVRSYSCGSVAEIYLRCNGNVYFSACFQELRHPVMRMAGIPDKVALNQDLVLKQW